MNKDELIKFRQLLQGDLIRAENLHIENHRMISILSERVRYLDTLILQKETDTKSGFSVPAEVL